MKSEIRIGSRGSVLALAQSQLVHEALRHEGHASRVVIIETEGDRRAPDTAWGEGAFVVAIERALLDGRVDVAVHSAKDIPTEEDSRLCIAAYLPRADPRDALVVRADAPARRLADLAPGSRVGTDSPRRTGFLLAQRPDLVVHPLHGNVDTRLRRLDTGETDALALACAGLDRMGLAGRIAERLEPDVVPPAPGQGAIAVQVRSGDDRTLGIASAIDDLTTRLAVEAERAFLRLSGGGCRAPIGALATIAGDELELLGGYARPEGSRATIARRRGPVAAGEALAGELAAALGATRRVRASSGDLASTTHDSIARRILVTRAAEQSADLLTALRMAGFDPVVVPAIAIGDPPSRADLERAARGLRTYRWVVVTSGNGARAILGAVGRNPEPGAPSWAAIGPSTRRVLEQAGIGVGWEPRQASRAGIVANLPIVAGDRVLVVRGDLADDGLARALRARGAVVDDLVAYRTREAPETSRALLRAAVADGRIAAVVFTSGSTVRGLVSLGQAESIDVRSFVAVCIGVETADAARAAGFRRVHVAATPDPAALAAATTLALHRKETP